MTLKDNPERGTQFLDFRKKGQARGLKAQTLVPAY